MPQDGPFGIPVVQKLIEARRANHHTMDWTKLDIAILASLRKPNDSLLISCPFLGKRNAGCTSKPRLIQQTSARRRTSPVNVFLDRKSTRLNSSHSQISYA